MVALKKLRRPKGSSSRSKASGKKMIKKKVLRKKTVKKTTKKVSVLNLKRSKKNPIIEPNSNMHWES